MLRRLLTGKTFIIAGIVLALLTVAFYTVENWRGRRAWEVWRAAAEKRGTKLFLTDFVAPEIPDSENFAAIPLFRDVFAKLPSGEVAPNPFRLYVDSHDTTKLPKPPNDIEARRFDAAGWQEFFLKTKGLAEKTDSAASDILRALAKYEPAMQQVRDASLRPRCKFPTNWEDGAAVRLPHLSCVQALGTHLALRMNASLALGRNADALAEFRLGMRLHAALSSEPCLIAGLIRISILGRLEGAVWDGLAAGQWGDAELAAIESQLASLRFGDDFRFAFASERGLLNTFLLKLVTGSSTEIYEATGAAFSSGNTFPYHDWTVVHFYPRGWLYRLLIRNNDYFDWFLSRSDGLGVEPPIAGLPTYLDSDAWRVAHPTHPGVEEFESILMMDSKFVFDTAFRKYLYAHTRAQETRLACALERFRHARGAFPEKLEPLIPDFLPTLPKDIFDGQPLRYRRNPDGGYDLWSIGSDRKDGGGMRAPKDVSDQADDWIWHMPGRAVAP